MVVDKSRRLFQQLFKKGFFHIAGSNIINRLVVAITNIIIARFLGKYNYGVFGAAYNIYSIFIIFSGLGMFNAILVYCSEKRSDKEKELYYGYGLTSGFLASGVLSILLLLYGFFGPVGIEESKKYIILISILPLLDYIMQYFLVIFRSQKQNKLYAIFINISSFSYLFLGGIGAKFFGITGTIIGRYISYVLMIIITSPKVFRYLTKIRGCATELGKDKIRNLWSYSLKNGASGALNQILYFIDIALIAGIISNPEVVASYKVSVLIPEGLSFIPSSIMVFLVPLVAEHNKDGKWLRGMAKKLFLYTGLMNAIISCALFVLAPYVITILWGKEYLDSVPCFRLLSINYFVLGTFRMPCTNVLAVLHKVNFNLILGIVSGILDVVLDYILIINFGAIGAAIATISTVLFVSCFSVPYLLQTLKKM